MIEPMIELLAKQNTSRLKEIYKKGYRDEALFEHIEFGFKKMGWEVVHKIIPKPSKSIRQKLREWWSKN